MYEPAGFLAADKNNTWPTCCHSCSELHVSENSPVDTANCIHGTPCDCWLNVIKFSSSAMRDVCYPQLNTLGRKYWGKEAVCVCVCVVIRKAFKKLFVFSFHQLQYVKDINTKANAKAVLLFCCCGENGSFFSSCILEHGRNLKPSPEMNNACAITDSTLYSGLIMVSSWVLNAVFCLPLLHRRMSFRISSRRTSTWTSSCSTIATRHLSMRR